MQESITNIISRRINVWMHLHWFSYLYLYGHMIWARHYIIHYRDRMYIEYISVKQVRLEVFVQLIGCLKRFKYTNGITIPKLEFPIFCVLFEELNEFLCFSFVVIGVRCKHADGFLHAWPPSGHLYDIIQAYYRPTRHGVFGQLKEAIANRHV